LGSFACLMPFPAVTEPMAGVVDLIDWLKVPHILKTSSTFGVHTLFTLELPRGESTRSDT